MKPACMLCAAALLSGCASAPRAPAALYRDLAPTGVLRVGLVLSNQVLVTRDSSTGELRGVSISLGRKLAARIGTTFRAVGYPDPATLVKSFGGNEWDIAFLAYDPARAQAVDFSPPYMVVDNTYLVPAGSLLEHADSVDRPGIRIAVPDRSAPDLYLSRHLKAAQLVRVRGGSDAAREVLRSGRADAYAENAHMLDIYSRAIPGSRLLGGRYAVIEQAIAIPKGRAKAVEYVRHFVEQSKADGSVRAAIVHATLRRAAVAP